MHWNNAVNDWWTNLGRTRCLVLVAAYTTIDVSAVREIAKIKNTSNVAGEPIVNQRSGFFDDSSR
jgi:hypothetical protein